ncbi:MAG TPA: GNAT family N-acetyltransferase [Rhodanobacteraceae bacterium]|nr:GNAT family N-acetyltransferase [Rhodanobacteraceae bacterium]
MNTTVQPSFVAAPVIETERLRLRAHRPDDFDACRAIWSDPEVVRHIGGKPASGEDAWRRVLTYAGLWSLLGFGYWAIEARHSGEYVGDIGYAEFRRDMLPSLRGMLECGWALARAAQGRGYASEALAAIETWRRAHVPESRAVCIIAPGNAASIRVAEKAGLCRWCETTYRGEPTLVFTHAPLPAPDA